MSTCLVGRDPLDRTRYPVDPWRLAETRYDESDLGVTESVFALGNGYLGMRATPEEGRTAREFGTYVNGFHETWEMHHAEAAYGFAKTGQTMVNVPDTTIIRLYVDDEPLTLGTADLLHYERSIDWREGILVRDLLWQTPSGKQVRVRSTRMISFTDRHLAVMTLEVTLVRGSGPLVISSQVLNRLDGNDEYSRTDTQASHRGAHTPAGGGASGSGSSGTTDPRKGSHFTERVLKPVVHDDADGRFRLGYRCARSGMTLGVAVEHTLETDNAFTVESVMTPDIGKLHVHIEARKDEPVLLTKAVAYHTSRSVPPVELLERCDRTLDRAVDRGHEELHADQREWLEAYWQRCDVVIDGCDAVQQATRWCLYQLAQAAARADQYGIAAKGVTGSGYEGHYFWDSEIYVVPFLTLTNPTMARNALRFRVNQLDRARERARELTVSGALYPWRTINGEEASAYYAAGTAQYHINADIAHAFTTYADVTGDRGFLSRDGAVVLVETARMWADLGFWRTNSERTFHIHGVTGPDEYTTVVNNNLFTNVMAQRHLRSAAAVVRALREEDPAAYARLEEQLGLTEDELDEWDECAQAMYIPYDEGLGIHPQDEQFLEREVWDLEGTPPENLPLLLHYHPLVIYRFQVLKQADVVLAMLLAGEQFTPEQKKANFDYYDPITTGDSTLSAVAQSIMASEVGYHALALDYFRDALFVDLADLHGNTADGVHVASAGGVWSALVYGFAGMRLDAGRVCFDPRLPRGWEGITFPLKVGDTRLRVRVEQSRIGIEVTKGDALTVEVRGEPHTVAQGAPVSVPLPDQGPRLAWEPNRATFSDRRSDGSRIVAEVPRPRD